MKRVAFILLIALGINACAIDLHSAIKTIPEIAEDQTKIIDVIWSLDRTNRNEFVDIVVKSFRTYPADENVKSNMVRRLKYYCWIATNVAPTVSLQIPWNTQLEHQNRLGLKDINVRSDPETVDWMRDSSNPSGVEIITTPFEQRPIQFKTRKDDFEPHGYYGQGI